jgi:hypothetical protein
MKHFLLITILATAAAPYAHAANFAATQGRNYGYAKDDGSVVWVELLMKKPLPSNGEDIQFAVVPNGSADGPIAQSSDGDSAHYLDVKYTPNSFTVEEYIKSCPYSDPFSCQIALNWQTVQDQTYIVTPGSLVQAMYQDAMSGAIIPLNNKTTHIAHKAINSATANRSNAGHDAPPPAVIRDGFGDEATAWLKKHPAISKCADQKADYFHKQNGADAPISSDVYGDFISQCAKR